MPIDTFRGDGRQPAIYAMPIHRPFEDWHVAGIFNMEDLHEDFILPLETGRWSGQLSTSSTIGRSSTSGDGAAMCRSRMCPRTAAGYWPFAGQPGVPQLVGTNMHILQGAVDIEDCRFEGETLRIVVGHPMQRERKLFIWRPAGWTLAGVKTDAKDYLVDDRQPSIMCIHFNGRKKTSFELSWRRPGKR